MGATPRESSLPSPPHADLISLQSVSNLAHHLAAAANPRTARLGHLSPRHRRLTSINQSSGFLSTAYFPDFARRTKNTHAHAGTISA